MNEQQMEAVEHLVESGVFPDGLIAITLGLDVVRARAYLPEGRTALHKFYDDILEMGEDEDDSEEWKRAGVT